MLSAVTKRLLSSNLNHVRSLESLYQFATRPQSLVHRLQLTIPRFMTTPSTPDPPSNTLTPHPAWNEIFSTVQTPSLPSNSVERARMLQSQWEEQSRITLKSLEAVPISGPYAGRTVRVQDGNVGEAFRKLEQILARNKVRTELRLTERHEKKGVKRRRLRSERWRRQFANEVRKKVQLVTKIRNRSA